jgi:cilia- and flagella-associated protein 57
MTRSGTPILLTAPTLTPSLHLVSLQNEKAEAEREFEETKHQLEEDADREIEELKDKYEQKLQVRGQRRRRQG